MVRIANEVAMSALSFKDWLTEQTRSHAKEQEIAQKKEDWLNALYALFRQMREWLRQDDPQGVIKLQESFVELVEEEFGEYSAPSLRFDLNGHTAVAMPIARNVLGPSREYGPNASIRGIGRVDLLRAGEKIHLFRIRDVQNQTRWVITRDDGSMTFEDLTRESFESALQRLFS